uniref:Poly [ADP-ribose] polymerase 14-like n=1 Tax=Phallusia mammillata TaxID=59560 RepID=A0A6F9DNP7_9ASCI|nr:poly [ADP-ribose] polymerase 14-like [Phallusia mammillata]
MAKSKVDVDYDLDVKSWSDLLLSHPSVFQKGKRFHLFCAKNFQQISKKDFQSIVDDNLSYGHEVLKITDGFLIEELNTDEKQFMIQQLNKHYQMKWNVVIKQVPPVHPTGFFLTGAGNVKPKDLREYLSKLERMSGKKMDFLPSPTVISSKEKFRVIYDREIDIDFLKAEMKKTKFKDKLLKMESLCHSDCVRIDNLPSYVTDEDIERVFKNTLLCEITSVQRSDSKVALVYMENYHYASFLVNVLENNKSAKTTFGDDANFSLYYPNSTSSPPDMESQSTSKKESRSAIEKTKLSKHVPKEQNAPSSDEGMDVEYSHSGSMAYQQIPGSSGTKSLAIKKKSDDSNGEITFEFKPSVPYDVMEFVHLSPEVFNELKKNFNSVKLELLKKRANMVEGFSMFYVVKCILSKNKKIEDKYRESETEFEQNCFKRVEEFLSQLSTKTEFFNFDDISAVRSDQGWDNDAEDLIAVQTGPNEMAEAFVRWNDMKMGNVTVSGYRGQIDDVIAIFKKAAKTKEAERSYTLADWTKHYQERQRKTPSSSHQHQSYAVVGNLQLRPQNTSGNFFKLDSELIPWFVKYSKTESGIFKEVELQIIDGGVKLTGETNAATRAQHWVSEIAPQLTTERQKLVNDEDIEFLNSESGKRLFEEIWSKTKCSVALGSKSEQPLSQTPHSGVVYEGKLSTSYSDIIVRVVKTDITDHHCDAIVNASNEDLKLLGGISGSILNKGGWEIQKEMDDIARHYGRLFPGQAVRTSAGNGRLPCKTIIHVFGPRWYYTKDHDARQQLRLGILQLLQIADRDGSTSIALPAISSGIFGGKSDVCAKIIVCAIESYFQNLRSRSNITRIDLVEIMDYAVLQHLQSALQTVSIPVKLSLQSAKASSSYASSVYGAPITRQPTTAQSSQLRAQNVNVTVKEGDITMERCDAIVNPSDSFFNFNGQVAQNILKKGGYKIKQDCQSWTKNLKWNQDIRVTSGGKLPAKHIMHIAMPHPWNDQEVVDLMADTLKEAEKRKFTSIGLPAIGTGNMRIAVDRVACLIKAAIDKFSSKNPKHLKDVRIVIFDKGIIGTFERILLRSKEPVFSLLPAESSVDPTLYSRSDINQGEPVLVYCSDGSEGIKQAKRLVEEILKKERLNAKTYVEEIHLTNEQGKYWSTNIPLFETRYDVVLEVIMRRHERRAKLTGEKDKVKNAKIGLQRDFEDYKRINNQFQHHTMEASSNRRPASESEARMSQQAKKQESSHTSKPYNEYDYSHTASVSRADDAKQMQSGEKNNGDRTKELQRRRSSDEDQKPRPDKSRDSPLTSDVDDDKSGEKKEVKSGARDRHRERRLNEKGAKSLEDKESNNDCKSPKNDKGVREGSKDISRYREEMKNKPEYIPGDHSREKDQQKKAFRKASTTSLPDSLEGSSSEEDRLSHDERKFDFPPKASSTFHATTSSSPSYDVEKTGQKKINDKQKSLVSKLDEGNDSDDEFVDAMDELPTPSSQGKKCVKVENMDEGNRDLGSVISNFDSNQIRNKGKGKAASDEVGEKKESEAKRPKPAPRKSQPLSGKTQSFSRSTSEENSEQTDVKKSEQNLAEKSEQNTVEKMEKSDEEKTEPRDEKMKQDFGRNPISETKNRQPALSNTEASKEMSKDSLEQKEKEKNKRGAAAKEGDRASDGRSGERKPEKQAKPLSGEGENTVNRSEERSEQGESNRERESAELNGKKKADSSGKEGPKSGGAKSNPIQKLEKEVKQGAEQINNDLAFFNLSGNRSEFTEEEWGKNWRTLKTDEWLLVNIPEGSQKYQAVVDRSGIKSGSQMPNIVQMQQIKNPKLYQKFKEEKKTKPSSKNNYHFYPIVKEDVVENLCGLGWNNSVDQSDACSSEGAAFFKDIQTPLRFAWVKNNEKQVIMADVIPDNISEHASAMLTITKNERAYPLYLLTIKS